MVPRGCHTRGVEWIWPVVLGVVGLFVGGFLTTVASRVPDRQPLAKGPQCAGCGADIVAADRIPVASWVILRGRCRTCGASIPRAYPLIELSTALLFAATTAAAGVTWELPALLYLAALAVVATAIDLQHHRLPDAIVLPSYPAMLALLALALAGSAGLPDYGRALLAAVAMFAAYLVLAMLSAGGLGGGDVKLAGVLGLVLGWYGWWQVLVGAFSAFFLGAIVGVLLLILGRVGRRTQIPFGPFMFLGTYVGLLFGDSVAQWYLG